MRRYSLENELNPLKMKKKERIHFVNNTIIKYAYTHVYIYTIILYL